MTPTTVAIQIHLAPKETCDLFLKTRKKFKASQKEEKLWGDFDWVFRKDGFQDFTGQIFRPVIEELLTTSQEDITLIKPKKQVVMMFMGTPEKLKETLEIILADIERKEKLRPFK